MATLYASGPISWARVEDQWGESEGLDRGGPCKMRGLILFEDILPSRNQWR